MQPASFDIWDKKYRLKLKDGTVKKKGTEGLFVAQLRLLFCTDGQGGCSSWAEL
jgi:hypothetical protein